MIKKKLTHSRTDPKSREILVHKPWKKQNLFSTASVKEKSDVITAAG